MGRRAPAPSRPGRPVGADGEQTRARIVGAAMRCVAEVGYSRATIREIARAADMTSGSLYHYFPNKSELLIATVGEIDEIAAPRLRAAAARGEGVVDRIEAVLDESGRLMREYPDLAAFEWAIRADSALGDRVAGDAGFAAFRDIIEGILGDAEGAPADARGAAEAVYALIYGLTELGASLPPRDYHAALAAAKRLIRGTLLGCGEGGEPLI
ncbi:TetR family transcriptional regulator [Mycobacterium alsense]|uniref:TetR family transcriptional regulator n=1 Tax=Mycobacterium alsense TaxID=324058 RepID=A0ABD6P1I6_9MYCO|nr:TetR/AcrR family transcriptional regulator [Mycobacterium alsense]OBG35838.1 TetR family transcriptional regulator [Mycobacterium alsense]